MYANNLSSDISSLDNGCIVDIETEKGEYLGTGYLSKESHITVRIFSKKHETIDYSFFLKMMQEAWKYRKSVEPDNLDNCRVIFGEADGLPG